MNRLLQRLDPVRRYRDRAYRQAADGVPRLEVPQEQLQAEGYSSQCGQDKWLVENLFRGQRDGVFVDIGAHDGLSFSNTVFFERRLGWRGVAIEPNPSIFPRLAASRQCITVNACISATPGVAKFRAISGYAEMLSGLVGRYDARHLQRIEREIREHGGGYEEIDIRCLRLDALLAEHGIDRVDYLSIDVEGAELEILGSIDFEAVRVRACGVENNYRDHRIPRFMKARGYGLAAIVGDEIYVREGA